MSKYILKKDLPFAKAGTELDFLEDGVATVQSIYRERDACFICELKDIDRLIEDNWVEEVKPREFLVFLNKEGFPIDIFLPDLAPERALDEVIKVREVLWHTENNQYPN